MPKILLIGGSDGSCGAGLFADYQTILSLGSTAGVVVTSVTAQNDQKFLSAYNLPPTNLKSQFESLDDFVFDSIKIGMIPNLETASLICEFLKLQTNAKVIIDPVFKTSSGGEISTTQTIAFTKQNLFCKADLITPNILEASMIAKEQPKDDIGYSEMAAECLSFGSKAVLVKGGHAIGDICADLLVQEGKEDMIFERQRIKGGTSVRGTGCRLSSAIAHYLGAGFSIEKAVGLAGKYVWEYIEDHRK